MCVLRTKGGGEGALACRASVSACAGQLPAWCGREGETHNLRRRRERERERSTDEGGAITDARVSASGGREGQDQVCVWRTKGGGEGALACRASVSACAGQLPAWCGREGETHTLRRRRERERERSTDEGGAITDARVSASGGREGQDQVCVLRTKGGGEGALACRASVSACAGQLPAWCGREGETHSLRRRRERERERSTDEGGAITDARVSASGGREGQDQVCVRRTKGGGEGALACRASVSACAGQLPAWCGREGETHILRRRRERERERSTDEGGAITDARVSASGGREGQDQVCVLRTKGGGEGALACRASVSACAGQLPAWCGREGETHTLRRRRERERERSTDEGGAITDARVSASGGREGQDQVCVLRTKGGGEGALACRASVSACAGQLPAWCGREGETHILRRRRERERERSTDEGGAITDARVSASGGREGQDQVCVRRTKGGGEGALACRASVSACAGQLPAWCGREGETHMLRRRRERERERSTDEGGAITDARVSASGGREGQDQVCVLRTKGGGEGALACRASVSACAGQLPAWCGREGETHKLRRRRERERERSTDEGGAITDARVSASGGREGQDQVCVRRTKGGGEGALACRASVSACAGQLPAWCGREGETHTLRRRRERERERSTDEGGAITDARVSASGGREGQDQVCVLRTKGGAGRVPWRAERV